MATHVLLNSIDHKDLKVITEHSAKYGDNIWFAQTFAREFRSVQAHYPILFNKDANTGQFIPVALFGFQNEENLFLKDNVWDANYIPLSVQRLPFSIGFQNASIDGVTEKQRVLSFDMDSPRVSKNEGVDLFLEFGGNSEYLENIASILETLHLGLQDNANFVKALESNDLIESVTLDVELKDDSKNQMLGFYTINEESLNNLSDAKIAELHNAGYLQAAYLMLASQVHFRDLVNRKNKSL